MTHAMNCTDLDERLADYLEGDLQPADRQAVQAHIASCVRCTALVRDLEQIRTAAGQLDELTPSRDLWVGIADRIETPVLPLAPRAAPNVVASRRGVERLRLAAVAAALVAVTAGVTYTLTVSRAENRAAPIVQVSPDDARDSVSPDDARDSVSPAVGQADLVQRTVATTDSAPDTRAEPSAPDRTPNAQNVGNTSATASQSREIDRLRTIFARNRAQLDPRTAAIIEANLKVIDEAIAQSRDALAQDPASRFLSNQLNSALDKKVELLRTAAMLPNRT
jgi:anti-sigma factor RsiW